MKLRNVFLSAMAAAVFTGCNSTTEYPDVTPNVKQALKSNGLGQVDVNQDRDKGVVTLKGTLSSEQDRAKAEQLAKNEAGNQVVADEIAVVPPGNDHDTKTANSDVDDAIEKNLDAALIKNHLNKTVKYSVKNGVVTLTGNVKTSDQRHHAADVAKSVPNVTQVVNELQLKNQPATSSR